MSEIILGKSRFGNVKIDLDILLRTRALIEGNSGSGKSRTIRRLVEQMFGKVQIIILDLEGEFATLREKFGFVLVGKGGETPADTRSAAMLAHKLLELKASAVCDLYEMKAGDRHRWVRLFLEALVDAPKNLWHPVVVIIDEIHTVCPEKGAGESEASDAVIGLATRGRKRGYCLIGATQRLGKFRKDAAAELMNVLVGMTFIDVDRKRAAEALGIPKSEERKFMDEIKVMDPGNFWALGRAISKDRVLVKVGGVETTHPEMGSSKHSAEPPPPPEKVRALLPKLAELPRAAEEQAKTVAEFKAEVRSLKAQLSSRPRETAEKVKTRVERVEVPILRDGHLKRLEVVANKIAGVSSDLKKIFESVKRPVTPAPKPPGFTPRQGLTKIAPATFSGDTDNSLDKPQKAILGVLAQYDSGCEAGKLALLAGYRLSGGFRNALSALRTHGYLSGSNTSTMTITDAGRAAIDGQYDPLPVGRDLANYWLNHHSLGSCERKILQVLLENPDGLGIGDLASASGYEVSGGFRNALSSLRTAGVIIGRNVDTMQVSEDLKELV